MPEAESLLERHARPARARAAAAPPPPPVAATLAVPGPNRLLLALEATLEPLVTVLSLWLLVWMIEGSLTPSWLIVSVVAFALASPGRSQLRLPADRVLGSVLLAWGWTAGLLLAMGFATGLIYGFSSTVVLHWLWFAPAAQLATHWALRQAAPHLVRLQGPTLRAVVVGMNEQGCSLADRLRGTSYSGIELVGYFDDRTPNRRWDQGRHRLLGRLEECDLDYLRNWSLRLDLYIILKTVRLVFRDSAAY